MDQPYARSRRVARLQTRRSPGFRWEHASSVTRVRLPLSLGILRKVLLFTTQRSRQFGAAGFGVEGRKAAGAARCWPPNAAAGCGAQRTGLTNMRRHRHFPRALRVSRVGAGLTGGRPPWPEQRGHALPPRQAPRACLGASQTRLWREDTRARGSPQGSQWQRAWGRVPGPRATAQDRPVPRAGPLRPPFPPGPPYPQHVRPLTLYFWGCHVSSVVARLPRVRRMDTSSSGARLRGSWVRRERSRIPAPLGGSAHGLGAGSAGAFRRSRRADMPSRALSRRRAPTRSCSARLVH